MKHFSLSLVAAGSLLLAGVSAALAAPKDYQVTGPIISMTDTTLVVQKGKEQWEIAKNSNTTGVEGLRVGDKITVHYTMTAALVESKSAPVPPKDRAAAPKKGKNGAKADAAPAKADAPAEATASKPAAPTASPAAQ